MEHEGFYSRSTQRMQSRMEFEIHNLERFAYGAVLRAFKAQSSALSWDKERLITELRRELRLSNDEHRELLMGVNSNDSIHRINERREGGRQDLGLSRDMQYQLTNHEGGQQGLELSRDVQYQLTDHVSRGDPMALVGQRVMRRWPEDGVFYEAIITEYNRVTGHHALVYNINTPDATEEWIDIKQVPHADIRWLSDDPKASRPSKARRGRPSLSKPKNQRDGTLKPDEVEIYNTRSLIRKVEQVLNDSDPDESDVDRAKKLLKEHEETLVQVIAMLKDVEHERPPEHRGSPSSTDSEPGRR